MSPQQLAALLQLSSPSLPIGGYSYSQGFEAATDCGVVHDELSAQLWISSQLLHVMGRCEAPVWLCLYNAWVNNDEHAVRHWNAWFLASRETREMRQETLQMGWSLTRLANDLSWLDQTSSKRLGALDAVSLPCIHASCIAALAIEATAGLTAYLFMWLENQVMAAIKSIPLGQVSGQRLLSQLRAQLPETCRFAHERASATPPRLETLAPQFAILASRHETQYSRLFRS